MEDLAAIRLERLTAYMQQNQMVQPDGTPSPSALSEISGRKVNYCNDLLKGNKSFGARVARALEKELSLTRYYLDGVDGLDAQATFVRRIHQRLSAGEGHAIYHDAEESWLAFQPHFLRKVGVSEKNAAIFDVSGRSMEPVLHDGAVVLINMNTRYDTIINGKYYAFIHDGKCLVKTLFKQKDGTLQAHSENPDKEIYPDFLIDGKHSFELLGMVLWEGRTI